MSNEGHRRKSDLLNQALEAELGELEDRDELRSLEIPTGINLCSNDYLGLSTHPALKQGVLEGVARAERMGSTGSRLLAGHAREWNELEEEFAAFAGTEAALFFTSGYAANIGLLTSILGRGDTIFSDASNHASLIDGMRLSGAEKIVYSHGRLDAFELALHDRVDQPGRKIVVTESVFGMEGDFAPLAEINVLAKRYGAEMVVDEAQATGVFGPEGRGRVAQLGLEDEIFAVVHTCGKALASAGAFVCGSATLKNYLINRARTFLFTTALPPYFAAQVHSALKLARAADEERSRLAIISERLRNELQMMGWDIGASASQIVPVMLGENAEAVRVARELERNGFAVRAIRPPTVPTGTARLRLSLTSKLTDAEITKLARVMTALREDAGEEVGRRTASASGT
ncbi:MAG TPA: 8-amino-7-oxononanoate synthase [Candidatus Limnocylindrales bacterium]|nr:8-amino-7-oxononanoate synthase [Candidatus Limnocylindrales bacterium]